MNIKDLVLLIGGTLRLTRFITSDSLGEWTISGPLKKWAITREVEGPFEEQRDTLDSVTELYESGDTVPSPPISWGWRSRLVSGLECPFCVGFWVTLLISFSLKIFKPSNVFGKLLRVLLTALSINYVTAHVSSKLD